ncbi:MAG: excinuclease ABC subunit A [Rhodospirillaceae bacterium]|nr:excinuclease ABC subunit A [Rhodospirillaceae bacterium]|tara:strand:- start:4395 stop:7223 length:2829 start_codon:yes stop_codon:yes gene_type:complete
MSTTHIRLRGARTHNLKDINLDLPRNKLIVITGLSGSGKSSLAFDTIYAEGQRRYVESLSTYARQFLSVMPKPKIDHIEGLSPTISIEQKSSSHNPRSTVGTVTEIYDYLRLLFARAGEPHCPIHKTALNAQSISQMVDQVMSLQEGTRVMILAPLINLKKGNHAELFKELKTRGFIRARINGLVCELESIPQMDPKERHTIEAVIDRLKVRRDLQLRLAESIETGLELSNSTVRIVLMDETTEEKTFSNKFACSTCGYGISELEPRLFSFNNPAGACTDCDGLGMHRFFDPKRVVRHPHLSLAGGAVRGWDRRNEHYFQLITGLANHYSFDIESPFETLSETVQKVILFGSKDEQIKFHYVNSDSNKCARFHSFEGIIPNMQRRYTETDSNAVREELGKYQSIQTCIRCKGSRLNDDSRNVLLQNHTIHAITSKTINESFTFFSKLKIPGWRGEIAEKIAQEIKSRLGFLIDVGLDYLTLSRGADTLSGGESQRIRLASQIGSGLIGVVYILDEPSIGLHQRDHHRLLDTLQQLRDIGNTVIVVEHDEETILAADHVIDIGPGAGTHGGRVIAEGTPENIKATEISLTGQYLARKFQIPLPKNRREYNPQSVLSIRGACGNNLKNVDVDVPVGLLTCVTGVSGSGKSTLINDTLYNVASNTVNKNNYETAPFKKSSGLELIDRVIEINQNPIGRTPRSNPATYTGLFAPLRELFAATKESRSRGYKAGRFSFNVKGGRCESCQGDGVIKVEMHFLPDVYVSCDICNGKRYNRETLDIRYKGKNIHEILQMTTETAFNFFRNVPNIRRKLETLMSVGLGYVQLGQNAVTLSGGEAQRIKLAKELSKRSTGSTLYVLDEPTTGLHFHDISQLLEVLYELRDQGNTIVIIEHNLEVIKTADWVIDLGPEGGSKGGRIIATGTPESISKNPESHTGMCLAKLNAL